MLRLPVELVGVLESARSEMRAHPSRQLLPRVRQAVYFALGRGDDLRYVRTCGYLASITARYVLPIWLAAEPRDHLVESTIRMAEAVWRQQANVEAASRQLGRARTFFEQLAITPLGNTATFGSAFAAGFAGVKALAENLDRVALEGLQLSATATDRDVDPWSADTAQYAAMAFSGPVWTSEHDISRRQAFWEWWLGSAVPSAWRAVNTEQLSP